MPTTIKLGLDAYSSEPTGVSTTLKIKLKNEQNVLNTGGNFLDHKGNGWFEATIEETIENIDYRVVIEKIGVGIADGLLFAGQNVVGAQAGCGLDAAGVRAAIGMASANLDTQLGAIEVSPTIDFSPTIEPTELSSGSVNAIRSGLATSNEVEQISTAIQNLGAVEITRIGPEYEPLNRCITLQAGDDYLAANGNALTFAITLPGVDLSTCTARFAASADYKGLIEGTATLVDTNTESPKLRLEWTKTQTSRPPHDFYTWAVRILNPDELQQTILLGQLKLKASPFIA